MDPQRDHLPLKYTCLKLIVYTTNKTTTYFAQMKLANKQWLGCKGILNSMKFIIPMNLLDVKLQIILTFHVHWMTKFYMRLYKSSYSCSVFFIWVVRVRGVNSPGLQMCSYTIVLFEEPPQIGGHDAFEFLSHIGLLKREKPRFMYGFGKRLISRYRVFCIAKRKHATLFRVLVNYNHIYI